MTEPKKKIKLTQEQQSLLSGLDAECQRMLLELGSATTTYETTKQRLVEAIQKARDEFHHTLELTAKMHGVTSSKEKWTLDFTSMELIQEETSPNAQRTDTP